MDRDELLTKVEAINVWKRGDQRAPHKPLLLLIALGRVYQGADRLSPYADIDPTLRELLVEFGPPRKSYHPEYPFWRLQHDGLWTLTHTEGLTRRQSNTDPTRRSLLDNRVAGGFPEPIRDAGDRRMKSPAGSSRSSRLPFVAPPVRRASPAAYRSPSPVTANRCLRAHFSGTLQAESIDTGPNPRPVA